MQETNTKKPYLYVAVAAVLALAAVAVAIFVVRGPATETNELVVPVASSPSDTGTVQEELDSEAIITYDGQGFTPGTITVAAGAVVTFVNQSDSPMWPASAVHPTHTAYPGSGIDKCGTDEEDIIFDSCRGLSAGESYSFVFEETGEWGYHNHLSPRDTGKVIVQ